MTTATGSQVEARRLARAIWLDAQRVGPGRYLVTGGSRPHEVNLGAGEGAQCDCCDYEWRQQTCKHILAVRLREADPQVLAALREIVEMPR